MTTRFILDGLWHCLCPSFDAAILTNTRLATSKPRPSCLRSYKYKYGSKASALAPRHRSSIHTASQRSDAPLSQSVYSHSPEEVTSRDHARQRHFPKKPKSVDEMMEETSPDKSLIQYYALPDGRRILADGLKYVPIDDLHDILRHLRNEAFSAIRVKDLVRHLVKERGQKPCLLYFDSLIRVNADAAHGSAETVNLLLDEMAKQGIVGDSSLFHSVLLALAVHPDHLLRARVLAEMQERWFDLTLEGWHHVVVGLLRDRQYEIALDRLEQMQTQDMYVQPWLYDIFIYMLCDVNELDEALRILQYRVDQGDINISANVWYHMLDVFSTNYHYPGTLYIWQRRISSLYLQPSDGTLTNVLSLAARYCDTALATDVVRVLTPRTAKLDIHHYECLLAAFAGAGDLKTAFRILCIMKKSQLEPTDGATRPIYTLLLDNEQQRLAKLNLNIDINTDYLTPTQALQILTGLHEAGHPIPVAAMNVILSVVVQTAGLSTSIKLYKQLHLLCESGPNISTFNILLGGCAKAEERIAEFGNTKANLNSPDAQPGYGKATAMFLASEMVALDVRPNILTYDRIILTCLSERPTAEVSATNTTTSTTPGFTDAILYLSEARTTFGIPPASSTNPLQDPTLPLPNTTQESKKCTPLRAGTWKSLILHACKLQDERTWELLDEMEATGHSTVGLRREVDGVWEVARRWKEERKRLARV